MAKEQPESELRQLYKAQSKALQDEVFGGLSLAEQKEYDTRTKRINVLEIEFAASRAANKSAAAKQEGEWNPLPHPRIE